MVFKSRDFWQGERKRFNFFRPQIFGKWCMKEWKITSENKYTCKVGRTNKAALETIHNHCTFIERTAPVLSEPASTFRLSIFDFCGIISTTLKKFDEQIKSGVA